MGRASQARPKLPAAGFGTEARATHSQPQQSSRVEAGRIVGEPLGGTVVLRGSPKPNDAREPLRPGKGRGPSAQQVSRPLESPRHESRASTASEGAGRRPSRRGPRRVARSLRQNLAAPRTELGRWPAGRPRGGPRRRTSRTSGPPTRRVSLRQPNVRQRDRRLASCSVLRGRRALGDI